MQEQDPGDKRVAFVTGASYGIGAATALALARDGFDIAIAATRIENLAKVIPGVEATGRRVAAVALDVRSQDSVEQAMAKVLDTLGRVDVLVNNAGVTIRKKVVDLTAEEWETIIATNVTGTFFMSQQMGRHLIDNGRPGCIINIGSTFGVVGFPERSAYGTSKAAVMHMTKMLAIEWAEHGIRVNAVAPGRVETGSPMRASTAANPALVEAARKRVPLGRFASSEEVAEAVCYLVSPAASYITGHTLMLDGGLTVQ